MTVVRAAAGVALAVGLVLLPSCGREISEPLSNRPPTAEIGGPYNGSEGAAIALNAGKSRDPEQGTLTYAWDFGDGDRWAGSSTSVAHTYRDDGSYDVTLVVYDAHGLSDTASTAVNVSNAAPIITSLLLPSAPVYVGAAATVQLAFSDPGALDTLTAQLDWGDSVSIAVTSGTATHIYAAEGRYTIALAVRDNDGAVTLKRTSDPIVIAAPGSGSHRPHAVIGGPYAGVEGSLVRISARGTSDPDGDSLIYRWMVDDSLHLSPAHLDHLAPGYHFTDMQFLDDGTYRVFLVVTDPTGAADTASTTVTISDAPPHISFVLFPTSQIAATPVELSVGYHDYPYRDTQQIISWWGDGKADTIAEQRMGSIVDTLKHTYTTSGSYLPSVTVIDDDGGRDSMQAANPITIFDPRMPGNIAGYETLDLGTLGGVTAIPAAINDLGQIVGTTPVVDPQVGDDYGQHGFNHAFLWQNGVMHDLGTLPGHRGSSAQRINNDGVVAGSSWWANYATSGGAVWTNGGALRLQFPALADDRVKATAASINAAGDVLWNRFGENRGISIVQRQGETVGQQVGDGYSVKGSAMNNRRQIVGDYGYHPPGTAGDIYFSRGFLWQNGAIRELQPLSYPLCPDSRSLCPQVDVFDINDSGQSVGFSRGSDGVDHFVSWSEDGTVSDLGIAPLDDARFRHIAINDRAQIAGSDGDRAFFWDSGTAHPVGSLGGGHTHVVDLNEDGTVVGMSTTPNGEQHIFIWSVSRGMVDLGTGPQGLSGAWAIGINARGDVIGMSAQCVRTPSTADEECLPPDQPRATLWRVQR